MIGGRLFFQYGDSVRSFANVLFFIKDSDEYIFHRPHIL